MDAATLVKAQPGLPLARANQLVSYTNAALVRAGCTTVRRAAMFLAQIGHESVSLQYQQEIGTANYLQAKPYWPYIGRTYIQVTWDYNYRAFGRWCVDQHLLTDPDYFHKNPALLATDQWAWLGAVWYWTVSRPGLNAAADRGDVAACTLMINGGYNGLANRQARYNTCLALGNAILPPTAQKDWFDMATRADLDAVITARLNERLSFWLPRVVGLLRFGTENRAFQVKNAGTLIDNKGVEGHILDQLAAMQAELAAIKAKVGA